MPRHPEELRAYTFEALTVNTTAVAFTASKVNPTTGSSALCAYVSCETANIRFTIDGTTVNATTSGHVLAAGTSMLLTEPNDIRRFSAVRSGATNGALKVTYFGA